MHRDIVRAAKDRIVHVMRVTNYPQGYLALANSCELREAAELAAIENQWMEQCENHLMDNEPIDTIWTAVFYYGAIMFMGYEIIKFLERAGWYEYLDRIGFHLIG